MEDTSRKRERKDCEQDKKGDDDDKRRSRREEKPKVPQKSACGWVVLVKCEEVCENLKRKLIGVSDFSFDNRLILKTCSKTSFLLLAQLEGSL
jgi:hypothetical protein